MRMLLLALAALFAVGLLAFGVGYGVRYLFADQPPRLITLMHMYPLLREGVP